MGKQYLGIWSPAKPALTTPEPWGETDGGRGKSRRGRGKIRRDRTGEKVIHIKL